MPVTGLDHFFVRARDLERSRTFYCVALRLASPRCGGMGPAREAAAAGLTVLGNGDVVRGTGRQNVDCPWRQKAKPSRNLSRRSWRN